MPDVRADVEKKVVVVMPAYNAGRTLRLTYEGLPKDTVSLVTSWTMDPPMERSSRAAARLEIFVHNRNYGYGANQKTCYRGGAARGADIVVMVHPDYQYDPRLGFRRSSIPESFRGEADVVFGSRLKSGSALAQGMPWWKYFSNRFLTNLENRTFDLSLSEFHTGYRAFRRGGAGDRQPRAELGRLHLRSGRFVAQIRRSGYRIAEIAVPNGGTS